MLVFEERGKPEYPKKNSRRNGENWQQTQPTFDADAWFDLSYTGGEVSALATVPPWLLPNKRWKEIK